MTDCFVGLDLGGTNIKSVLVERVAGEVVTSAVQTAPTEAHDGPAAVAERLVAAARSVLESRRAQRIGVGVPGLFDPLNGQITLLPNLPGAWAGFPLRDVLVDRLDADVYLVNDARAFALAEAWLGAGVGADPLLAVTLGTGVGGGLVLGGRLHLGAWGTSGEFGHQVIAPDGPPCGCGNRGCVEAFTRADVLCRLAGRRTAADVYEGARHDEAACVAAVATVGEYLGIGIANVVTLIGPRRVVVGGGIATAGEVLFGPLRDAVARRLTLVPAHEVEIVPARLGAAAGAIGAALAAEQHALR